MKSSAKNFLLCFPEHMASKPPLCFLCLCNCTFIQTICQHHTCSSRVRLATFKSVMLGTLTACFSILRKYASHSSSRCFLNVCIVSFSSLLHSLLTCVINNHGNNNVRIYTNYTRTMMPMKIVQRRERVYRCDALLLYFFNQTL